MLTSHYLGFNRYKSIISGMFIVKYLGGFSFADIVERYS
jgi:hypothetical protein